MNQWELTILDWIRENLTGSFCDSVMKALSGLANAGLIWIALAVVLLCVRRTRYLGAAVAVALALDLIGCNLILKPLVARIRPFDLNPAVSLLIPPPNDPSFPSGHTAASFAAASALYFAKSRLWIPAGLLAVSVGFSRLYLYVHYPSDVLCGAALGIAFGLAAVRLVSGYRRGNASLK